jgi:hypothetical protein
MHEACVAHPFYCITDIVLHIPTQFTLIKYNQDLTPVELKSFHKGKIFISNNQNFFTKPLPRIE